MKKNVSRRQIILGFLAALFGLGARTPPAAGSEPGSPVALQRIRRIGMTTDPLGTVYRYTYDANGRLTSMTDNIGKTYSYSYVPRKLSCIRKEGSV